MADFEDLRLVDLIKTARCGILKINETRDVSLFNKTSRDLQNVYNFYVTAKKPFTEQEEYLKNLFSSFNYAAVIVNDGIKNGGELDDESKELLMQCIEIMLRCCDLISQSIDKQ
ncbi:MAG: hypothetical protein LUD29_03370 [Clostridia bacterium]|nr:hypothetical protein [Clostridia bacterium]